MTLSEKKFVAVIAVVVIVVVVVVVVLVFWFSFVEDVGRGLIEK